MEDEIQKPNVEEKVERTEQELAAEELDSVVGGGANAINTSRSNIKDN
jgi:hypothetical protein